MTDITEYDMTDFDFVERKGNRRKNKDTSIGKDFFTVPFGDAIFAGKNRRKSDERRNTLEVVDITGTTLWTNDDIDVTESNISRWRL